MRLRIFGLAVVFSLVIAAVWSKADAAQGSSSGEFRTIAPLIQEATTTPLHIVYIHGIRASAPGFSEVFRNEMCKRLLKQKACVGGAMIPRYLDLGDLPPVRVAGRPVWTPETSKWARPFVAHYVYRRESGPPVIVDEVNYWPLLVPFKCRFLIDPDAFLTGPDKADIRTCANDESDGPKDYLHPWITSDREKELLALRNPQGRAALLNGSLKAAVLDWGLSDAVIVLGPMKYYTRLTIWCAFEEIASFDPDAPPTTWASPAKSCKPADNASASQSRYVVISESLGSFVLLDAFAEAAYTLGRYQTDDPLLATQPGAALQFIVNRSDNIYFFANQFALLELGRVAGTYSTEAESPNVEVKGALQEWAGRARGRQLIAFNDPSDILTLPVPDFCAAPQAGAPICTGVFHNVTVHNAFNWFGLVEWPTSAHTWYSRNPTVLRTILGR
jgi:hypothetical protein